jgi:hypothetical protein
MAGMRPLAGRRIQRPRSFENLGRTADLDELLGLGLVLDDVESLDLVLQAQLLEANCSHVSVCRTVSMPDDANSRGNGLGVPAV